MVKALTGERASTSASQIVTLGVSLALSFWHCWQMTLVMLGLFPLIGLGFAIQHMFVTKAAGSAMTATNEAGSVATQTLVNIRTINSFGLEGVSMVIAPRHFFKHLHTFEHTQNTPSCTHAYSYIYTPPHSPHTALEQKKKGGL